jgi:hypothetical protein
MPDSSALMVGFGDKATAEMQTAKSPCRSAGQIQEQDRPGQARQPALRFLFSYSPYRDTLYLDAPSAGRRFGGVCHAGLLGYGASFNDHQDGEAFYVRG